MFLPRFVIELRSIHSMRPHRNYEFCETPECLPDFMTRVKHVEFHTVHDRCHADAMTASLMESDKIANPSCHMTTLWPSPLDQEPTRDSSEDIFQDCRESSSTYAIAHVMNNRYNSTKNGIPRQKETWGRLRTEWCFRPA